MQGIWHGTPTVVNLTGELNLAADGGSFSIRMEMLLRSSTYSPTVQTYHPGTLLKNLAQLVSSEQSTKSFSNYKVMDSSGDLAESPQDDYKG